jgi:tetratricopeptide (TPR) repeat protein
MRIVRAVLAALILCSFAGAARADDDQDAARLHFQVGQSYYDEANYTDALKEFREAYRLSKRPALLYNIGLCHEHLGQLEEAVAALDRYLRERPDATDRGIIEQRMSNLKRRLAAAAPKPEPKLAVAPRPEPLGPRPSEPVQPRTPAPVAPRPSEPVAPRPSEPVAPRPSEPVAPRPVAPVAPSVAAPAPATARVPPGAPAPPRRRVFTWVFAGVAGGLFLGALGAGVFAQLKYSQLSDKCPNNVCPSSYTSAASDRDAGRAAAIATDVLWPLGVVATGVATALFFVEGRPRKVALAPAVAPSFAGLAAQVTF